MKFLILHQKWVIQNCTAVFEMIADENTVMIKAAHVGQLLLLKKEKVWQRERI